MNAVLEVGPAIDNRASIIYGPACILLVSFPVQGGVLGMSQQLNEANTHQLSPPVVWIVVLVEVMRKTVLLTDLISSLYIRWCLPEVSGVHCQWVSEHYIGNHQWKVVPLLMVINGHQLSVMTTSLSDQQHLCGGGSMHCSEHGVL